MVLLAKLTEVLCRDLRFWLARPKIEAREHRRDTAQDQDILVTPRQTTLMKR
jgi:hypothetical protein